MVSGKNALLLVDVQYDFCKGGNLEVSSSDDIFPPAVLADLEEEGAELC